MQFGKDGTGLLVDHLDPTVIVQQKAHLYQVFSSALGADKALVVKGFLYFLCQHVEHDGQSLDVVVLVRSVAFCDLFLGGTLLLVYRLDVMNY